MSEAEIMPVTYLNCAPGFWTVYAMRPGMVRRRALLAIFRQFPRAMLPVNQKWQANLLDPDLRYLMKKGVLRQARDGGGRHLGASAHKVKLPKSSLQRQSYLVLRGKYREEAA